MRISGHTSYLQILQPYSNIFCTVSKILIITFISSFYSTVVLVIWAPPLSLTIKTSNFWLVTIFMLIFSLFRKELVIVFISCYQLELFINQQGLMPLNFEFSKGTLHSFSYQGLLSDISLSFFMPHPFFPSNIIVSHSC